MKIRKSKKAVFTICSNNYLPYAKILLNSLRKNHEDINLFLCLADRKIEADEIYPQDVTIIEARELNIPNFDDFAFRYDIMEFNTALKPFMMSLLIEEFDFEQVVYLDPDIKVFAPLNDIFYPLESGMNFSLTPHITDPSEINTYPNDVDIMKAGIYNLGFIGVSNHEDVISFLHWWGRRLRFECVSQQDQGLFVDQKFVDLVPAFYEKVNIVRHPGLNVAYWNLHQRELTYDEEKQSWFVNGSPLVFFHFSGINPRNRKKLSKHTESFSDQLDCPLQKLVDHYIDEYHIYNQIYYPKDYSYSYFLDGTMIIDVIRKIYRNSETVWIGNPFENFHQYLNQTHNQFIGGSLYSPSNFMYALWQVREDLQKNFRLDTDDSLKSYFLWFFQYAFADKVDSYFIKPAVDTLTEYFSLNGQFCLNDLTCQPSKPIGLIGYLKTETGVGQAARSVAKSLESVGIEVEGMDVDINVVNRRDDKSIEYLLKDTIHSPLHIFHVNADQLSIVRKEVKEHLNEADYSICMPYWELSIFPSPWLENFDGINEVWVGSEFVRAALQAKLNMPVFSLPPAVSVGKFEYRDRQYFGLPENCFLFHFNFDFSSYSTRKNPEAVIKAYRMAFHKINTNTSTALVVKVRGDDPGNQQYQKLLDLSSSENDIIVINKQLSHSDSIALMNCCDCYVSLHRSEGFGYTLAEAMLLGKPVIATHFSGSNEFIHKSTAFPIRYDLVPLTEGDYPFYENQYWAQADIDHAAWIMQKVVNNGENTKKIAANGMQYIQQNYSFQSAGNRYLKRLKQLGLH